MAQVTLNPSGDNYMQASSATTNNGTAVNLDVGSFSGTTDIRRSLIKFDLTSIPSSATITLATLRLYDTGADLGSNTRTMRVFRSLRAWSELQSTWNVYTTGNNWGTAGAANTSTDREATDIGTVSMPGVEVAGYVDITLTTSAVQAMYDGSFANNGFVIVMDTENTDLHRFDSNDGTNKPQLVVTYTTPGGNNGYAFIL